MNEKVINKSIEIARRICHSNKNSGIRASHVAFLVRKNKIIEIGWNKGKTHPATIKFDYISGNDKYEKINVGIHAEFDVVMKYKKDNLKDYEMIVIRIDRNGYINNSRPCYGCGKLINNFNIKSVYYSSGDGKILKLN